MNNCSIDILEQIKRMQLFALGNPTSKVLRNYSENKIIKPNYPDIYKLSDLIYDASKTEVKRNYVIAKTK